MCVVINLNLIVIIGSICPCKKHPLFVIGSSALLPRHCEECRRHDEAISLRGFLILGCAPHVRHCEEGWKPFRSNLFFRTFGIPAQLHPNYQRLLRTLRVLAMTDLRGPKREGTQWFLGIPNHHTVLCNDLPTPRHCEECRKARRSNLLLSTIGIPAQL